MLINTSEKVIREVKETNEAIESLRLESYQAFDPIFYLEEYYANVGIENYELLRFFAQAYRDISKDSVMLEFGGGPSLYSLISASKNVKKIHFSDYLKQNIAEIKSWKISARKKNRWKKFFEAALLLEGQEEINPDIIAEREELLNSKLSEFHLCNAFNKHPIGKEYRNYFDIVSANFVAESITTSRSVWKNVISNICSTLNDRGILIMTSIRGAEYYCVNGRHFPAVPINESDLLDALISQGFSSENIDIHSIPSEMAPIETDYKGYTGLICIKARKLVN